MMKQFKMRPTDPEDLTPTEAKQLARNLAELLKKKKATRAESQEPGSDSTSSRALREAEQKERLRRLSLPSSVEMMEELGFNMDP